MKDDKNLEKLTKILEEEITLFQELLKFEKIKNMSIINQDIKKIKELSENEEKYLEDVEKIEEERERIVSTLFIQYNVKDKKELTALVKALPEEKEVIKKRIINYKNELVSYIKDLKVINQLNNKLLKDSIEFFNEALNSFKEIDSYTYTRNGQDDRRDSDLSLVINQIA